MTELADDAIKLADGTLDDPYFYGKVYAVPDDADIYDEANWYLANPALDKFRSLDDMRSLAHKAQRSPAAEAAFKNLYLNQRVDGTQALVNSRDWKACQSPKPFSPDDMLGLKCYGGLDLSKRLDLSAFTLSWVQEDLTIVATKTWYWTHENNIADREKKDAAPYRVWKDAGWLKIMPGKSVSYKVLVRDIAEIIRGHDLEGIFADRWRIDELKREIEYEELDEEDFKLMDFGQGFGSMAGAVDALESRVIEQTLMHDGNPITTWCLSNVKIETNAAGDRKFDKRDRNRRIDGAVTLAMSLGAIAKAERPEKPQKSIYNVRGIRAL